MDTHQLHLKYYRNLEQQLIDTDRFVEISKDNFSTYSIVFTQLLLSACAEIDTMCKLTCRRFDPTDKSEGMAEYKARLNAFEPHFYGVTILLMPQRIMLRPWFDWRLPQSPTTSPSPKWWRDHNKVKHHRSIHFRKGNLENCLNAVAALYALLYIFHVVDSNLFFWGGVNKDETYPDIRFFPAPRP